jgi:hypothetical protein
MTGFAFNCFPAVLPDFDCRETISSDFCLRGIFAITLRFESIMSAKGAAIRRLKVQKPIRFMIYVAILGLAWYVLSPAMYINTAQIGAPLKGIFSGMNSLAVGAAIFAVALAITYMITSGWGLILLGAMALVGLVVLSILHPYLFPLLIPLSALWVMCAAARRKESKSAAPSEHA